MNGGVLKYMLVNDTEEIDKEMEAPYAKPADVKFIRYSGYDKYCSLCFGILELQINGEKWLFSDANREDGCMPSFFAPTTCYANGNIIEEKHTAWETDISSLPEELRCFSKTIDEVINVNMPDYICHGCD